ncbi:hypothetical protein FTX61_05915 [Nitriliruptoraceae bacterium ZYF776]|nr:hypothetical protein [Profundirhabdus halotolerans]
MAPSTCSGGCSAGDVGRGSARRFEDGRGPAVGSRPSSNATHPWSRPTWRTPVRRRLRPVVSRTSALLPLLLVFTLLAAPAVASAEVAASDDVVVLAADADGEPAGPIPGERTNADNPASELGAYEELETPFTWAASFILLFAGVVGLVIGAGLYQLLVRGPRQRENAAS